MSVDIPLDEEQKAKALKAAECIYLGMTYSETCAQIRVAHQTLRKWRHSPWWLEILREAESGYLGKLAGNARKVISKTLDKGLSEAATPSELREATSTAKWLLERRDVQFRTEATIVHEHKNGSNLLDNMSPEQLRALMQLDTTKMLEAEVLEVYDALDEPDDDYEEHSEADRSPEEGSAQKARIAAPPGVHHIQDA